jgi:hypothetical protein
MRTTKGEPLQERENPFQRNRVEGLTESGTKRPSQGSKILGFARSFPSFQRRKFLTLSCFNTILNSVVEHSYPFAPSFSR